MSITFVGRVLLLALFSVALPASLAAQEAPAAPATAEEQEVEAWYTELQQLHESLQALQERALADGELAATQEALGSEIRLAMAELDPTMEERMSRMGALEAEATAAQQAGNMQKLQELMEEANGIQQHFMGVQEQVLQQTAVAAKLSAFQERLQAKMLQLDPEAEARMQRFRELEAKLSEAVGGM